MPRDKDVKVCPDTREIEIRVTPNADGLWRYDLAVDRHIWENGWRATWQEALDRAGRSAIELAGLSRTPPEGT